MSKYDWTEELQAKWATRRLLGDLGHDIPSSYFAICDMAYRVRAGSRRDSDLSDDTSKLEVLVNSKGLLAINRDRTIHHAKKAYRTVQHVTALFDDAVRRVPDLQANITGGAKDAKYAVFGYRANGRSPLGTLWRSSDTPGKRPEMERIGLTLAGMRFTDPVWVDLLTGRVFEIDNGLRKVRDNATTFTSLPVYDSAVVVAERAWIDGFLDKRPDSAPAKPATE